MNCDRDALAPSQQRIIEQIIQNALSHCVPSHFGMLGILKKRGGQKRRVQTDCRQALATRNTGGCATVTGNISFCPDETSSPTHIATQEGPMLDPVSLHVSTGFGCFHSVCLHTLLGPDVPVVSKDPARPPKGSMNISHPPGNMGAWWYAKRLMDSFLQIRRRTDQIFRRFQLRPFRFNESRSCCNPTRWIEGRQHVQPTLSDFDPVATLVLVNQLLDADKVRIFERTGIPLWQERLASSNPPSQIKLDSSMHEFYVP